MHKAFPLPAIKFPLTEELPTVSEDGSHCQKKRDATARKIALLSKTRRNSQSKKDGSYTNVLISLEDPDFSFNHFRYLKGTINLGLWYPKDSGFDLTAYSDADHAGCHLDRKKFIMAQQQQQQRDVPQDQLRPPNKRFDLMDANKKFDLVTPQCPNESKILADILNNHPLELCIAASMELIMSVASFRRIFQLPQATKNNNAGFVDALGFSQTVPFFRDDLGFSLQLRSPSNFVSKGLSQP
nr:hypothetical protein [Tanacetum cinerariifolium]